MHTLLGHHIVPLKCQRLPRPRAIARHVVVSSRPRHIAKISSLLSHSSVGEARSSLAISGWKSLVAATRASALPRLGCRQKCTTYGQAEGRLATEAVSISSCTVAKQRRGPFRAVEHCERRKKKTRAVPVIHTLIRMAGGSFRKCTAECNCEPR